jgi:hypothetical protein
MGIFEMSAQQVEEWRTRRAEGEKAALVGISVKDDPASLDLMGVLEGAPRRPAERPRRRRVR